MAVKNGFSKTIKCSAEILVEVLCCWCTSEVFVAFGTVGLTLVNGTGNQTPHAFAEDGLKRGGERRSGLDGGEGLLADAVVAYPMRW